MSDNNTDLSIKEFPPLDSGVASAPVKNNMNYAAAAAPPAPDASAVVEPPAPAASAVVEPPAHAASAVVDPEVVTPVAAAELPDPYLEAFENAIMLMFLLLQLGLEPLDNALFLMISSFLDDPFGSEEDYDSDEWLGDADKPYVWREISLEHQAFASEQAYTKDWFNGGTVEEDTRYNLLQEVIRLYNKWIAMMDGETPYEEVQIPAPPPVWFQMPLPIFYPPVVPAMVPAVCYGSCGGACGGACGKKACKFSTSCKRVGTCNFCHGLQSPPACNAPFGTCTHLLRSDNGKGTGGCIAHHPRLGEEIRQLVEDEIVRLGTPDAHSKRLHICTASASVCCRLESHSGSRSAITLEKFFALTPEAQLELIRNGTGRFHFLTEEQMDKDNLEWNRSRMQSPK